MLAECIENQGRFLPAIEEAIRAVCSDKTWVLPAHDVGLKNFKGTEITIDLRSSQVAWNLATARYWLGDKLSVKTRKLIDDELEQRIFMPFASMITEGKPRMYWLTVRGNHNSVNLAGVTGAALANIESREWRAFVRRGRREIRSQLLAGLHARRLLLRRRRLLELRLRTLRHARRDTQAGQRRQGRSDGLRPTSGRSPCSGGGWKSCRASIPSFADCDPDEQPNVQIMAFLSRRYGWGLSRRGVERAGAGRLPLGL